MCKKQVVVAKKMMIEDFHPTKIEIGKVEEKCVRFYLPSGESGYEKISFQTPKMKIPFDLQDRKFGDKLFAKSVPVSTNEIGTEQNRKRIKLFRHKIDKLERCVIKKLPEHIKCKTLVPSLWVGKNTQFSPIFKASIPYDRKGNASSGVFNSSDEPVGADTIKKGDLVSMKITLSKVWIQSEKIGLNWDIEQIKIFDAEPSQEVEEYQNDSKPSITVTLEDKPIKKKMRIINE